MGCKATVLPEPLPKYQTINCLNLEENTMQPNKSNLWLFRAPALHLHGSQQLEEETSEIFVFFINKRDGMSHNQFQRVHMKIFEKLRIC